MKHRLATFVPASLLLIASLGTGCAYHGTQGAIGGAAIGAGSGALIGHAAGDSGLGAIIGAGAGILLGGLMGNAVDLNEAHRGAHHYPPPHYPPPHVVEYYDVYHGPHCPPFAHYHEPVFHDPYYCTHPHHHHYGPRGHVRYGFSIRIP